jgi:hypothetical protein
MTCLLKIPCAAPSGARLLQPLSTACGEALGRGGDWGSERECTQDDQAIASKLIFSLGLRERADLARVVLLHGNVIRVDVTVTRRSFFMFDSPKFSYFQTKRPPTRGSQVGTAFVEVAAKRPKESDHSPGWT